MITKKLRLNNNDEALYLLGAQDTKLKHLERELKVEVYVHHNPDGSGPELTVRGSTSKTDKALKHLSQLINMFRSDNSGGTALHAEKLSRQDSLSAEILPPDAIYVTEYGKPIRTRGEKQKHYVEMISRNDLTIGVGPAGTGKTYLAVGLRSAGA